MPSSNMKSAVGSVIRSRRIALGFSQEELADRSGLHRTYVSDVERGERNLSLESLDRLSRALEISITSLFLPDDRGAAATPAVPVEDLVEVLLVEDNERDAELAIHAFRRARFRNPVHISRDGADALDFVFSIGDYASRPANRLPQLILLDLRLPKIAGLEVLRRIKADPRTQHIPVVVLTASEDDADIEESVRCGAAAYIVKPVNFRNLSEVTPRLSLSWALLAQD